MTEKHPCRGFEQSMLRERNKEHPNSCYGCVYLITREADWEHPEIFECNRTRFELPYRPSIKEWIPYPEQERE